MRVYPKIKSAYVMENNEKNRYIKQIYNFIRKKKLPKTLEVSLTKEVLEMLQESPEREYKKKYDVFTSQHPLFFWNSSKSISDINKSWFFIFNIKGFFI